MESHATSKKYGHINYKTKLLGIAPHGWKHTLNSPFDTKQLKVCKKPSQYSEGQLEISDHSALAKTAIVERRIHLNSELNHTDWKPQKECREKSSDDVEVIISKKLPATDTTKSSQKTHISDNDKLLKDKPTIKFLKQCHILLKSCTPDFLCDRLVLVHLATEDNSYAITARKLKFSSEVDSKHNQLEVIELKLSDLQTTNTEIGGDFAEWATKAEDAISSSIRKMRVSAEQKVEKINEISGYGPCNPYHHAFVEGEISKNGINKTKKFSMLMAAQIGGVWNIEENPENYNCSHLAEVKTANVKTFESEEFYKRVRMKRNWFQAHLAGEKNYLVGINTITSGKRCVKELLLYDVDKIPNAVSNAAKQHKFEPWNSDDIHQRLFLALEFIYDTVKDGKPDEKFEFIHYDNSDYLYYIHDESLLKKYAEERGKVMIYNTPEVPFHLTPIEHTLSQLKTIINLVGYIENETLPAFTRNRRDIELTFITPYLADVFRSKVIEFWKQKINIPAGFEGMRIKPKSVVAPQTFTGKVVRIACRSSYNNSGGKRM